MIHDNSRRDPGRPAELCFPELTEAEPDDLRRFFRRQDGTYHQLPPARTDAREPSRLTVVKNSGA